MILLAIRNVCSVAATLIDSSILTPHSVSGCPEAFSQPSLLFAANVFAHQTWFKQTERLTWITSIDAKEPGHSNVHILIPIHKA